MAYTEWEDFVSFKSNSTGLKIAAFSITCLTLCAYAIALLPVGGSAGSQTWYLTNESAEKTYTYHGTGPWSNQMFWMHKNSGGSHAQVQKTLPVESAGGYLWIADAPVTSATNLDASWQITIVFSTDSSGFEVEVGQYNPATLAFTERESYEVTITSGDTSPATKTITAKTFQISAGNYLAIQLESNQASASTVTVGDGGDGDSNSDTYLTYSTDTPDYPVPQFSTLVLLASGLVAGIGLLAYSDRKRK